MRRAFAALALLVAACAAAPVPAQEFISVSATGERAETTYVRMALVARADLRHSAPALLSQLDALKRAGATDVAVDIWDMGTVPYANSDLAYPDTTIAAADPLATLTTGCFDRGLRCWLWPSGGFEVWRTPLGQPIDPGPFLGSRATWTAVDRDGVPGIADSLAGVRRYTLNPVIRDVHMYLIKTFIEALGRYPVAGLLLDGMQYPSLDYSFDATSRDMFMKMYDPIDPRGLTPADTVSWANWYSMRNDNCRAMVNGLRRNVRKLSDVPTVAAVVRASPERRDYIQDWPQWNKRGSMSWVLVRPSRVTLMDLHAALDSTARELRSSTPSSRPAPGLGLQLDGAQPDATLRAQIAALTSVGGRILAAPAASVAGDPARWMELWGALAPAETGASTTDKAGKAGKSASAPKRPAK